MSESRKRTAEEKAEFIASGGTSVGTLSQIRDRMNWIIDNHGDIPLNIHVNNHLSDCDNNAKERTTWLSFIVSSSNSNLVCDMRLEIIPKQAYKEYNIPTHIDCDYQ